jgi:lysozyme
MWNRWFALGWVTPFLFAASVFVVASQRVSAPRTVVAVHPASHYSVYGIDVSHHQGAIDWARVAASGQVAFAWIKATEGVHHRDSRFAENWRAARGHDIAVGAYHYYSMCRTGRAQADHFIATVPKAPNGLPHAVDVEHDARCNRVVPSDLALQLEDFLDRLEAHYGTRPLLYATERYRAEHASGVRAGRWVAAYSRPPSGPWQFWQYSPRGRVPGIRGPVDRNVFAGTPDELDTRLGRSRSGSAITAR